MPTEDDKLPLPLEGIRVLDATHIVAGPFCAMILADMGAEVIKIERPPAGELSRNRGPAIDGPDGAGQIGASFLALNRNKKSVSLDLRAPAAKKAFENMVRVSDVLLENWGPGALHRLGLGFDHLRQINPRLVYASITGYGDSEALRGPYSDWPANNLCIQGMAGWMDITGTPDGPPLSVGDSMGDSVPGLWTALGILLALETRRKTGRGQHVDMAMYECLLPHTVSNWATLRSTGRAKARSRETAITAGLTVRAKDGHVVMAGVRRPEHYAALWRLIGREDLAGDTRYLAMDISPDFYFEHIIPAIEEWSQHVPKLEVCSKLTGTGFSVGMVQNVEDLDRCPHLEARRMFMDTGNTFGGKFSAVKTPVRLTDCADPPAMRAPLLGEHNREVLCGIGGITEEELAQMEADGSV
jgi:crotonobetainyl-CoA:carnitine CoA-transferase CaiB-like acyl-CoA transferase